MTLNSVFPDLIFAAFCQYPCPDTSSLLCSETSRISKIIAGFVSFSEPTSCCVTTSSNFTRRFYNFSRLVLKRMSYFGLVSLDSLNSFIALINLIQFALTCCGFKISFMLN